MPPKRRPRSEITPTPPEVTETTSSGLLSDDGPQSKKIKTSESTPPSSLLSNGTTAPKIPPKPTIVSELIDDGEIGTQILKPSKPLTDPVTDPTKSTSTSSSNPPASVSTNKVNPDLIDDGRPICDYDVSCYRKNPTHFQEYRHPMLMAKRMGLDTLTMNNGPINGSSENAPSTPASVKKAASSLGSPGFHKSLSAQDLNKSVRPEIELYKTAMKSVLGGQSKVSGEGRKLLKMFRQTHSITEQEHDQLLGIFGWSPDEYEDGEKQDDTVELDEERDFLRANGPDAFKIITIHKHTKRNKQQEAVWARASSKFYQTMSKAQANFVIKSVGVVVNAKVAANYEARKQEIKKAHQAKAGASKNIVDEVNEEWGFHGTSITSIQGISKDGFKMPDELKSSQKSQPGKGAAKKPPKVTFLDDGYFGNGLYFSLYSDYALFYSEERGSNQVLLCKVLTGKAFKCQGRMDGEGLKPGYDSHYSPQGNEIIVFRGDQVLPRYIITFEERDAFEREQEE